MHFRTKTGKKSKPSTNRTKVPTKKARWSVHTSTGRNCVGFDVAPAAAPKRLWGFWRIYRHVVVIMEGHVSLIFAEGLYFSTFECPRAAGICHR